MKKTILFVLFISLICSFSANAGYKTAMGKKVAVRETEDGEAYIVQDKAGTSFRLKKVRKKMWVKSTDGLHLRTAPSLKSKVIKTLQYGKKVTVIGKAGGKNKWCMIRHKGGYAFLWGKHLTTKKIIKKYLGRFQITAYEYDGTRCANGNWPRKGHTVACNSLPLGTKVYIQGIGIRYVEDRGASWHSSKWMDIYLGSEAACERWGIRRRKVWRLKK